MGGSGGGSVGLLSTGSIHSQSSGGTSLNLRYGYAINLTYR